MQADAKVVDEASDLVLFVTPLRHADNRLRECGVIGKLQ